MQYPNKLRKVNIPESDKLQAWKKMAVFIGMKCALNMNIAIWYSRMPITGRPQSMVKNNGIALSGRNRNSSLGLR